MALEEISLHTVIKTANLTKVYYTNYNFVRALIDCNLEIEQGEFVAVVGTKGSGKTTLLNLIGGLDYPSDGNVYLDEEEITGLAQDELASLYRGKIGFLMDNYHLFPELTVHENILLPLLFGKYEFDRIFYETLVERLKLGSFLSVNVKKLSYNQIRSAAVIRALINKPQVILADEPPAMLDLGWGNEILELLLDYIHEYSATLIMATNRPEEYKRADHIIRLNHGIIVENRRGS